MTARLSRFWCRQRAKIRTWFAVAVAAFAGACGPPRSGNSDREQHIEHLLTQGLYVEAERLAVVLRSDVASSIASRQERALGLLLHARVGMGKASDAITLELAQRLSRSKETSRVPAALADALHLLGSVYLERGEFADALPLHERGLSIRRQHLGARHLLTANSLDHVARTLIRLERFPEARRALDESVTIRDAIKDDSLARVRTLELVGMQRRYEGDYAAAAQAAEQSLSMQRHLGPNHPDLTSVLHLRGDVMWLQGRTTDAQRTWTEALSHLEQTMGPGHPHAAPLLRKLALAEDAMGNLETGRQLRERALSIGDASLAPCHPERGNLLSDVSLSLIYFGEYAEAQKKYEAALELYRRCLGERHSLIATATYNQADLALKMGDLNEAERLHQKAIDLWSSILQERHPYVARAVDGLAEVHAKRGQYDRAKNLYERALVVRREAGGPYHPDVAWTLVNLATTLAAAGNLQTAIRHVTEAIEIYATTSGADVPDHLARALELRGMFELRRGRTASARTDVTRALSLRRGAFGPSHPLVAATLVQLAKVDRATHTLQNAIDNALAAERISRDHLRFTTRYLPERQAVAYADARARGLDLAISAAAQNRKGSFTEVFDAVIRSRGVVLDEMAARAQLSASAKPSAGPLLARLHSARQRFANLTLRSMQADESVSAEVLDTARRQKELAERAIADISIGAVLDRNQGHVGVSEVRKALPAGSALVSFVRYSVFDEARASAEAAYAAFVMRFDADTINLVTLGPADPIDGLVREWRNHITRLDSDTPVRITGARLRHAAWQPLSRHITGISRVFIVPDGALNLVNFAALPSGPNRYLIDDGPLLHYLSTERDLGITETSGAFANLFAVGGPEFGENAATSASQKAGPSQPETSSKAMDRRQSDCTPGASLHFSALPGSANEVSELGRLWSSLTRTTATTLVGRAATEGAVRDAVGGRGVIHFATHGFFLGSGCTATTSGTRAVGGISSTAANAATYTFENSLARAGLAFAGANRNTAAGTARGHDGVLTAEEIAGLDLQGTHWAVLSACDTGIGEIRAGEGVFGLRRAFQIAGAKTVIMSLWSVEDQSTRDWMLALYRARLSERLDTPSAMRAAGLSVLEARRARHLSTHPFYWAAFVAAGDWH